MKDDKKSVRVPSFIGLGVAMAVLCVGMICLVGGADMGEPGPVTKETVKPRLGKAVIAVIVCLSLIATGLICWIVYMIQTQRDELINEGTVVVEERGSLAWVDAFTKREFSVCDQLVGSQDSRFYSPLVLTLTRDRRYYEKALNGAVDCIVDVGLVSVEDSAYKLKVRYKTYEPCSLDADSVQPLRGSYMSGSLSDPVFTERLSNYYFDTFSSSCFRLGEDVEEFTFVLTELEYEDIKYVSGSVEFIDLLLELSGLSTNFVTYEETVKPEIDAVLKLGFEDG